MIENLHPYLILVGLTIGVVMAALWYKARRASQINLALIRLNEQCNFDTPAFLAQGATMLAESGLRGLRWRLDWFGVTSCASSGLLQGKLTQRRASAGEMSVHVDFYQFEGRGEQRYFEQTLVETFMLLLRMDMLIKAGSTDATLSQMSRLNLFLQHDMKNIAQFIQLMGDQLALIPEGKEQIVLDYLRLATPLVRHRADRVVRTLTIGASPTTVPARVALAPLLEQLCRLYGLECDIRGDAWVSEGGLETVFDNLLKNYQDVTLRENIAALVLQIDIVDEGPIATVTLSATDAPQVASLERLFEPFWSSTPAGLGIGLYQARSIMESLGGTLTAGHDAVGRLQFAVTCPTATAGRPAPVAFGHM